MEETPGRASLEKLGCRSPPQLHAGGVGRQQQHRKRDYKPMMMMIVSVSIFHMTQHILECKSLDVIPLLHFWYIYTETDFRTAPRGRVDLSSKLINSNN